MLNTNTYFSLPRLKSYQEALKHFNDVKPIRGDANGTKPVGRRDQKWLSIFMRDDKSVCIGSTWNKERPLLAYYPDGRVVIESNIGASCRERIQRIAGLNIQRKNNEDWVVAKAYVDGEEVLGHYPLQLRYNKPRTAAFILHENKVPTYLNPVPVYQHTMNRKAKAEITARYKPFLKYVEAMVKLSAEHPSDNPALPGVSWDECRKLGIPETPLVNRYNTTDETRAQFLELVDSGDTEQWYKAMMWLARGYWRMYLSDAQINFNHVLHYHHRNVLFTKVKAEAGKLVQDRYGRYFR
jgi:hypothetical protein